MKYTPEQIKEKIRDGKYNFDFEGTKRGNETRRPAEEIQNEIRNKTYQGIDYDHIAEIKRQVAERNSFVPNKNTSHSNLQRAAEQRIKNEAAKKNSLSNDMSYEEKNKSLRNQEWKAYGKRLLTGLGYIASDENSRDIMYRDYQNARQQHKEIKAQHDELKQNRQNEIQAESKRLIEEDAEISNLVKKAYSARATASEKTQNAAQSDDLTSAMMSLFNKDELGYDTSKQDKELKESKKQLNDILKQKNASLDADELIAYYTNNQNILKSQNTAEGFNKAAQEHPVILGAARVLTSPYASIANAATTIGDLVTDGDYVYSGANSIHDARRGIKSGIEDKLSNADLPNLSALPGVDENNDITILDKNYGNVYSSLYDAIDMGAESAYNSLIMGGGLTGGIRARGLSEKIIQAGATGSFTSATMGEQTAQLKADGENIKDVYAETGKDAIINFAGEMIGTPLEKYDGVIPTIASEALEEVIGNAVSNLDDVIRLQDEGEIKQTYNKYIDEGKSESQALSLTVKELLADDIYVAGMAAVSSFGMAGGQSVLNSVQENNIYRSVGNELKKSGNAQAEINAGLAQDNTSKAYQAAAQLQSKLEQNAYTNNTEEFDYSQLNSRKLGRLAEYNAQEDARQLEKSAEVFEGDTAKSYVYAYGDNGYNGNVYDYNKGFNAVYMAQQQGKSINEAYDMALDEGSHITPIQATIAYDAAKNDTAVAEFKDALSSPIKIGATVVAKSLDNEQQKTVDFVNEMAKTAGVEVVIPARMQDVGLKDANGAYVNGKIVLPLDNQGRMMNVYLGHEMFHHFKKNVPDNANVLQNYVIEKLKADASYNYEQRLDEVINDYGFKGTREQQVALAHEEMAANACFTVFAEEQNVKQLVKQDATLAQKVHDFFVDLIGRMKKALEGLSKRNKEYNALSKDIESKEQIVSMFNDCLKESQKNNTINNDSVPSTGIKFSKKINDYPYNMQTVIKDYLNSVDDDILQFYNNAINKVPQNPKISIGKVTPQISNEISEVLGVDTEGWNIQFEDRIAKHISKDHGEKGITDKSMADSNDVARMKYVIENHDYYGSAESTEAYKIFENGRNKKAPTITFAKKINGTYYLVMAVPKKKTLWIVTAFMNKKIEAAQFRNASNEPLRHTSKNATASTSTDNVPQSETSVNSNDMQDKAKYSLEDDDYSAYEQAVKADDLKTAQQLVDKAAVDWGALTSDNGKALKLYHGTTNQEEKRVWNNKTKTFDTNYKKFTVFKNQYDEQTGHFFNSDKDNAGGYGSTLYEVYLKMNKPLIINCNNGNYSSVLYKGQIKDTYEWAEYAQSEGYDGVIFKNISDGVDYGDLQNIIDDYVVFNSSQIKSAEIITYDDTGKVIPLNKRFGFYQDIRYSLKEQPIDFNAILEENAELSEMNEDLKEMLRLTSAQNEKLKNEFKITDRHNISNNAVDKVAASLRKQYASSYDKSSLVSRLAALYDYMANAGKDIDSAYIWLRANDIAKNIIANSQQRDTAVYDEYKELRNRIRNTAIRVPQTVQDNFADYNAFRRENFGRLRLSKEGVELDALYNELSAQYPEFFDVDVSEEQQLEALANFFEVTSPVYYSASEKNAESMGMNMEQYANLIAGDIIDKYFDVPEVMTAAEKHKKEMDMLKLHYRNQIDDMRQSYKNRYEERLREVKAENAKRVTKLRADKADALAKQKAHFEDVSQRGKERRKKSQLRNSIRKSLNKIARLGANPDKKKHVPNSIIDSVKALADAVNFDDTKQDNRLKERLNAFQDSFEAAEKNNQYSVISELYNDFIHSKLSDLKEEIGNTPLKELPVSTLEKMDELFKMTVQSINNINRLFLKDRNETIEKYAENISNELAPYKKEKMYKGMSKSLMYNSMKPEYFFQYLGSDTLLELYHNLRKGEDVWAVDISEARDYALKVRKKYGWQKWDNKHSQSFNTSYGKIELTLQERLAVYANSLGEHTKNHLYGGGFRYQKSEQKGLKKLRKQVNDNENHRLSESDVELIVSSLDENQKSYVRDMMNYLSTVMGQKGNEVSKELYGIEMFKEKMYYPAKVLKESTHQSTKEVRAEKQLKNAGFTNSSVKNAKQPLVLMDFDSVWASHVDEMSKYHAFVLPLENIDRVYNLYNVTADYEFTSIKQIIENAYGDKALTYIDDLIKDINGGVVHEAGTDFISKATSLFKKNAVFASASVAVQQPSAIARAFSEVDFKYFVKVTGSGFSRKSYNEMKKYAPVAIIKEMGYFDTNMAQSTVDFLNNNDYEGIKEKVKAFVKDGSYRDEALSFFASKADEITWTHIWNACKAEVKANNSELTKEQQLEKAGERFTEVVTKTQVYDSVFSRSGLMRSRDSAVKNATAFMAEPTTSLNMLANAVVQAKRGNISKAKAGRVFASLVTASVFNSLLQTIVTAARADDDDKDWAEVYLSQLIPNFIDNLNPFNQIAFIKDIFNIFQGYDVTRADMNLFSDLADAIDKLDSDKISVDDKIKKIAGATAAFFGLPVKNILRDFDSFKNIVNDFRDDKKYSSETAFDLFKEEMNSMLGFELFNADLDIALKAVEKGDVETYQEYADKIYATDDAYDLLYSILVKYGYNSSQYRTAENRCVEIKKQNGAKEPDPKSSMKKKALKEYAHQKKNGTYKDAEPLRQLCIQLYGDMTKVNEALEKLND